MEEEENRNDKIGNDNDDCNDNVDMITTIMIITALINDKKKRKRCIPEKMKERGKIQYYRREITAGGGNEIKA